MDNSITVCRILLMVLSFFWITHAYLRERRCVERSGKWYVVLSFIIICTEGLAPGMTDLPVDKRIAYGFSYKA